MNSIRKKFILKKNISDLDLTNRTASKPFHIQLGKKEVPKTLLQQKHSVLLTTNSSHLFLFSFFANSNYTAQCLLWKQHSFNPNSKVSPKKLPQENHFSIHLSSQCSILSISTKPDISWQWMLLIRLLLERMVKRETETKSLETNMITYYDSARHCNNRVGFPN